MYASTVTESGVYPRRPIMNRQTSRIVKVAIAAIALTMCAAMTAAFPPTLLLVGGLIVTALFIKCLYNCGSTFFDFTGPMYRRTRVTERHVVVTPTTPYSPPSASPYTSFVSYPPPAPGVSSSDTPGPLSSEYTRSGSSRRRRNILDITTPSGTSVFGSGSFRGGTVRLPGFSLFNSGSSGLQGLSNCVSNAPPAGRRGSYPTVNKRSGALGSDYTRSFSSSGFGRPATPSTSRGVPPSGTGGSYFGGGKSGGALGSDYTRSS